METIFSQWKYSISGHFLLAIKQHCSELLYKVTQEYKEDNWVEF